MIATCPNCGARYRIREDRLTGSRARITCKKCAHKFIVHKDQEAGVARPAPTGVPVRLAGAPSQPRFEEDDESDVPTTVMPHGSKVIRKIRENTDSVPFQEAGGRLPTSELPRLGTSEREFPPNLRAEVRPSAKAAPPAPEEEGGLWSYILVGVFLVVVVVIATLVMGGAVPLPA